MPDILSHSFIVLSHADPTKSPSLSQWPLSGVQDPRFFSTRDPFSRIREMTSYMGTLAGDGSTPAWVRESTTVQQMYSRMHDLEWLNKLSVGISLPLREAIRGSFLYPPSDWPPALYRLVGRDDTANSVLQTHDSRRHPMLRKPQTVNMQFTHYKPLVTHQFLRFLEDPVKHTTKYSRKYTLLLKEGLVIRLASNSMIKIFIILDLAKIVVYRKSLECCLLRRYRLSK